MTTRRQRHLAAHRAKKNRAQRKQRREQQVRDVADRLLGVVRWNEQPGYYHVTGEPGVPIRWVPSGGR